MEPNSDIIIPSPEKIQENVRYLIEWMSKEPHLPKIKDEEWLTTFLYNNKFSLEKTKSKLENYYTLRNKYPEILKNRDPTGPEVLQVRKAFNFCVSHRSKKTGSRLFLMKIDQDANALNMTHYAKRYFMVLDALNLEKDRMLSYTSVVDCRNLSLKHLVPIVTGGVSTPAKIAESAYVRRTSAIHLVNGPDLIDKIIETFKTFFPKKYDNRFVVHTAAKKTLLEMVDEDILCSDYGGKGPSFAELDVYTQALLEKHRPWFEEQETVCSNELLRRKDEGQLEEMKGSFRKLQVD